MCSKGKYKVVLACARMVSGGNGGAASFFLNLDSRWRRVASFRPRPVPFSRCAGGPQNRSGHFAEKTLALPLSATEEWIIAYSVRYLDELWWNLSKCRRRLSSKVIRMIHFTDCFRILIIIIIIRRRRRRRRRRRIIILHPRTWNLTIPSTKSCAVQEMSRTQGCPKISVLWEFL